MTRCVGRLRSKRIWMVRSGRWRGASKRTDLKEKVLSARTVRSSSTKKSSSLERRALVLNVRADERVGLPHFIGVGFGEGQAQFAGAIRIGFEQFVLFDDAPKGVGSDLGTREQAFFDGQSVEGGARRGFAVDLGQDLADGFQNVFEDHFADFAFVGARF